MYTGRPRYLSFRASVEISKTVIKLCLSGGLVFLLNTTEDFSLFICAKGFPALLNAAETGHHPGPQVPSVSSRPVYLQNPTLTLPRMPP
jgi:hypothetical protein